MISTPEVKSHCKKPYFLSFHSRIPMEENLPLLQALHDKNVQRLVSEAVGVVLPKYVSPWRYRSIVRQARACFPHLDPGIALSGKCDQIKLFRRLKIPHPETALFKSPQHLHVCWRHWKHTWDYPVVLKGNSGGGGSRVFPIYEPDAMDSLLPLLPPNEPVLVQQWINHGGGDLRVVIYGERAFSYFRLGNGDFYNNVCRGAEINYDIWPEKQRRGRAAAQALSKQVGIDVAAFDIMFDPHGCLHFIEINFNFGTKGLGGRIHHHRHFAEAVSIWKQRRLSEWYRHN